MTSTDDLAGGAVGSSRTRRRTVLRRLLVATLALVAVLLAMFAWSLIEAQLLFVDRSVVTSPDLPPELNGTRVVFVSDIHAGDLLGPARVRRLVDRINALRPDLVLLGGDYAGGGEGGEAMVYPELARLRAPLGVVGVLGNREYPCALPPEECDDRRGLADADVLVLENDHARVGRGSGSIVVAGVGDAATGVSDVAQATRDVSPDSFAILVSHNPDVLPEGLPSAPKAFDLALAGHTHGGQITLFGLWAPATHSAYDQRFRGGWSEVAGTPVLVSRGTGSYGLPMRFFAPPEIHAILLMRGARSIQR